MDLYFLEGWLGELLSIPPHQRSHMQRNCLHAIHQPIASERERLNLPRRIITMWTGHSCGHRVAYHFSEWRTEAEEHQMRQACYEYALVPCHLCRDNRQDTNRCLTKKNSQ